MNPGNPWGEPGVYFFINPSRSEWAASNVGLDTNRDWVVLRAQGLDPNLIFQDEDFGDSPEESIRYGGTFAYSEPVPSELLDVYAVAIRTEEENHDRFRGLSVPGENR